MNGYEDYSAAGFPQLLASRRTVIAGLARLGDLPFGAVIVRDAEVIAVCGRRYGPIPGLL
jgi:hypothetical protein